MLRTLFRRGLRKEVQTELASHDINLFLKAHIAMAKPFLVSITLAGCPLCTVSIALVYSGALLPLPSLRTSPSYPFSFLVQAIDNRPLGSRTITHITTPLTLTMESIHQENIPYITSAPAHKITLGLPWFQRHTLTISWRMRITDWSPKCRRTCFPAPSCVVAPVFWDVDLDIRKGLER